MSYVPAFRQAVTPQPSPKARIVILADYLRPGISAETREAVEACAPIKLTNPHIWEAASEKLDDALMNYAVTLMASLSHHHDVRRAYIEEIFEASERAARPHFSVSDQDLDMVRQCVVTPCYMHSRFMPENQKAPSRSTRIPASTYGNAAHLMASLPR